MKSVHTGLWYVTVLRLRTRYVLCYIVHTFPKNMGCVYMEANINTDILAATRVYNVHLSGVIACRRTSTQAIQRSTTKMIALFSSGV